MEKKRYIFEVDDTLLKGDFKTTENYFEEVYGWKKEKLLQELGPNIRRYEKIFKRYTLEDLARFLSMKSTLYVSQSILDGWLEAIATGKDIEEEGIRETLEELKKRGKSLAVLTNWFGGCQRARLEKLGLLEYFDDIYGGEETIKPQKEAYQQSLGSFPPSECVVVGPNVLNDYVIPKSQGMQAILYDRENLHHKTLTKVKRMNEIIQK